MSDPQNKMPGDALNPSRTAGSSIPGVSTSRMIGYDEERFNLTLRHVIDTAQRQHFREFALYPVAEYIAAFHCSTALLGDDTCFYINSQPGIGGLKKGDTPDLAAILGAVQDQFTSYVYLWEVKRLWHSYWYREKGVKVAMSKLNRHYAQLNKYAVTLFEVEEPPPKRLAIFHSVGPYFSTLIFDKSQLDELQQCDILAKDLEEFPELLELQTADGRPVTPPKDSPLLNALKTFRRTWCRLITPVVLFAGEPMFEGSDQGWRLSSQLRAALYKASVINQPMSFSPSWLSPDEGDLEAYTSIPSKKEDAMEAIRAAQQDIMDDCRQKIRQIKHKFEIARGVPLPSENDSPETRKMFQRKAASDEADSDYGDSDVEEPDTESDLDEGKRRPKRKLKRRRGN